MPVPKEEIEQRLQASFKDASWKLIDTVGDQDHYDLEIEAKEFFGKSKIEQHKMVNKALEDLLAGPLHALKIITKIKD